MLQDQDRIFTNLYGMHDRSLAGARARGHWDGTAAILAQGRDWIIAQVKESGLRGRGGAGFPTGLKWSFMPKVSDGRPGYLIVNADESEPGTCKDREIMRHDPHTLVEGCLIAGFAMGAVAGYIYIRGEYIREREVLQAAIDEAYDAGLLGKNACGSGYDYDLYLHHGAGAYICGEESAMLESIEGKRGLPRHRPPFVAQVGLFNRPTLVNNVETLYWVTRVLREGGQILSGVEKNGRKGLRSFSVSGRVKTPGVHLLPAGSTIRDVIDAAGGMLEGHRFKAYQPGGPSSGLLPASMDDIPLDFDMLQPHGSFIGSAAVVVLSDKDSARDAALNMLRFFEDESCGQCTPCRVGCEKAVKLMQAEHWDQPLLTELCSTMADASICGLGQAAPNPIRLTMQHFPDES